jgi:trk system potassium uptake protein TrkA
MSLSGASVVVIDHRPESFIRLTEDFSGFTVEGDATELSVLRNAKIESANALVAVTGNDNVNISVVQIAGKMFGVSNAIARIKDEEKENYFGSLDLKVVSPVSLLSTLLLQVLADSAAGKGGGK